jgi:hypothetical protein
MPQEHYKTPRPEPSTPTGSAPPLPQASPPASAATGTQCLRFPPLARSLSPPVEPTRRPGQPLSTLALSRSVPEPQTKLTPPPHQAPPGQSSRRPPSPSRENNQTPRIRCHLNRANDTSTTHTHPENSSWMLSGTPSWPPPDASSTPSPRPLTTTDLSQHNTGVL